jgi:hypothetical protein
MRTTIASFSLLICAACTGSAAGIVWSASQDNAFGLANGSNLPVGDLVRIGTFNISDGVIAANASNVSFLDSHFVEFADARIGDNVGGLAGYLSANSTANSGASGLNIAGAQIYLWAFASTDNSSLAESIATVFQMGIFYLDKASKTTWTIPAQDPVPGSTSVDLSDLTNSTGDALVSGAHVVVGSFPDGTSDQPPHAPNFGLALVPEPSVSMAALSSLGLLALRRRRQA